MLWVGMEVVNSMLFDSSYVCVVGIITLGHRLKVLWGKAQAGIPAGVHKGGAAELPPVPGLPGGNF